VCGADPSDAWPVGSYQISGTIFNSGTILHYNGTSWSSISLDTTYVPNSVWGTSTSDVWAVGGTRTGNAMIMHYNGISWSKVSIEMNGPLFSVWGSSASDVWAVGYGGMILHGSPPM